MTNVNVETVYAEALVTGTPPAQIESLYTEALVTGTPPAQIESAYVEVLAPTWDPSPSAFKKAVLDRAPGLFYENDDTTGTVAVDSTGKGRHGTYVGTPTLGRPSLLADGTGKSWSPTNASSWITRAAESWMSPASGGVSVVQLFKLSALPPSLGALFARDDASGTSRHWVLYVTAAGGFRFLGSTTTVSNVDQSSSGVTLAVGKTYCVGMVWDYSTSNVKVYLQPEDGSASVVFTVTGFTGVEANDARPFTVGALDQRSDLAWYHRGDLKATAFYPSVLSASDFSAIADAAFSGGTPPPSSADFKALMGVLWP